MNCVTDNQKQRLSPRSPEGCHREAPLARFVALHAPEWVEWCGQVRTIPFKKAPRPLVTYLEKPEMDALLATPEGDHPGTSGSCLAAVFV